MKALIYLWLLAETAKGQGVITTFAGAFPLGDGGAAFQAALVGPAAITFDRSGNLFIAERFGHRVRKVSIDGTISTIAGVGLAGFSGDGGPATSARLSAPGGLRFDKEGALLIADVGNNRIRRVTPAGIITTIAGNGRAGFSGDEGPATLATLSVGEIVVAPDGTIFFVDNFNHRIRSIGPDGIIHTVIGSGESGFLPDGSVAGHDPKSPIGTQIYSLAMTPDGSLLVGDQLKITRVGLDGTGAAFAGSGDYGFAGDGGPAVKATFSQPRSLAVDPSGSVYVGDNFNCRIRRISPDGLIDTFAGRATCGSDGDGGGVADALVGGVFSITVASDGSVYFVNGVNNTVRRISPDGQVSRFAGIDSLSGDGNLAAYARLLGPRNVALSDRGELFVADGQNRLRRIARGGRIETIAGTGFYDATGDGGPAVEASILTPVSIAPDGQGAIYLGDSGNSSNSRHRVRRITRDGIIETVAGTGAPGFSGDGGPATQAMLFGPGGVAIDSTGNLYIADTGNHRIRRVSSEGIISTFAGNGQADFSGDGGLAVNAALNSPVTVALDSIGNLYISDRGNGRVRRVSETGVITTVAGNGSVRFSGDGGDARDASFSNVSGLACDSMNNLYIADTGNHRIRRVSPNGVVTTVAGNGTAGFTGDGGPATFATLNSPRGVAVDSSGVIYIADSENHRIRRIQGNIAYFADPSALVLSSALGGPAQQRSVSLTVPDKVERGYSITTDAPWLRVSPVGGTVSATSGEVLTVTADPAGLRKGSYSGIIRISNPRNSFEFADIAVVLTVSGTPQQMKLSQTGLFFATVAAGNPPPQSFRVLNTGIGGMNWSASVRTLSGGSNWLALATATGVSQANTSGTPVDVRVDPTGLAPGSYFGQVSVAAVGVDNAPQSATVVLSVLPADRPPGPAVDPAGMLFTEVSGGAPAAPQTLRIANVSDRPVNYAATVSFADQRTWFNLSQTNGSVFPGQPVSIDVRPVLPAFPAGIYRGQINLRFTPDDITTQVNLLLVVSPSAGLGASTDGSRAATVTCQPNRLALVFRKPGTGFATTAGAPVPIEVQAADNCGNAFSKGEVKVSFSNGDPAVTLESNADGRWSGTWAARGVQNTVTLTARAAQLNPRLEGTAQLAGNARENATQPVIQSGGVWNAASRKGQPPVSPGGGLIVNGAKLSQQQQTAANLPLPSQLGDTVAFIAGQAIPLRAVSDGRVEGVLPFDVADSTVHQLVIRRGTTLSLPEPVVVAAAGPAMFTVDESGVGQGRAVVANDAGEMVLADPSRPARGGELVQLWCTGLGVVNGTVVAGQAAPPEPVSSKAEVQVSIQGVKAAVRSAVLAPGLTGVYLVTAVVPDGLTPDASAVVVVTVNGQASPAVTIAIQ